MSEADDVYERGIAVRDEMLGSEHGRAKVESQSDFTADFEHMVTRYCFGEVWSRPQLDRKTRSMLTMALLVALNRPNQLKGHVRGAVKNGVTKDELGELITHLAFYSGWPTAITAASIAKEVFEGSK